MLEFHVHIDMGLKAAAKLAVKRLCEILIVLNKTHMGLEIQKISTNLYCNSHVGIQNLNAHQPIFPYTVFFIRT